MERLRVGHTHTRRCLQQRVCSWGTEAPRNSVITVFTVCYSQRHLERPRSCSSDGNGTTTTTSLVRERRQHANERYERTNPRERDGGTNREDHLLSRTRSPLVSCSLYTKPRPRLPPIACGRPRVVHARRACCSRPGISNARALARPLHAPTRLPAVSYCGVAHPSATALDFPRGWEHVDADGDRVLHRLLQRLHLR